MHWKEISHSALRFIAGFMFLWHGYQKLFGFAGSPPAELISQRGLGGIIEFFGGLLICIGLYTRWSAFIASGSMAVAYWQFHAFGADSWAQHGGLAWLPLINGGELAVLYCFVFLFLWANGPGAYSVDAKRARA